jgi:hypothetical protein
MSEPGFASLGPSLLARKGGAKPAMRPQVAPLVTDQAVVPEEQLEDLGWNDMGHDESGAKIVPINADIAADEFTANPGPIVRRQQRRLEERVLADAVMTGPEDFGDEEYDEDEEEPVYGEAYLDSDDEDEEESVEEAYAPAQAPVPAPAPAPAPVAAPVAAPRPLRQPAPAPAAVTAAAARRAAFTLRLDADRHLKLRLAATMQGVSAQALVTEALDRLLAEYDDLDVIANHLKRH